MKKLYRILIITILIGCFSNSYAQNHIVDSLKNWIKTHPKIDSQYIQTLHRISYRLYENDIQQAFDYYEQVSTLSDSMNFTYGKSIAQINLGLLLYTSGNYEASNSAYFRAIDYAESCGALRAKAVSLNNIADNFNTLNQFKKCREYTAAAIAINTKLKAWRGIAVNYELLQQCDLKENLFANAKKELMTGMPFALMTNDPYILSSYYLGFGKLHAINDKIDSANYYFNKALSAAIADNSLRNEYQVYIAQVEYLNNISIKEKIKLLHTAYSISKQTRYLKGVAHSAELLSKIYDLKNNKDSSLAYYRIYRIANDSLFFYNNQNNVIIKESDWMIKRKESENQHLEYLGQLQKRDLVFKNTLVFVLLLLLMLIVVVSFVIYKNIQSNKKRSESSFRQKIAETQMQSLRAQMNPHFIFNSLNSIENFIMRNERRAASTYLNKFSELVRIILDSSRAEFAPFAKDLEAIKLYVELEQLRFNNKFSFFTWIDQELINGEYNVPALLIQPYIENAVLHGLSQSESNNLQLNLSAVLEDEYIIYTIHDNGIGRKKSNQYKNINKPYHSSVGLKLTQERIDIFNLEQNAQSKVEVIDLYDKNGESEGTTVQLKIKAL